MSDCTPEAKRPTMLQMEYLLGVHQRRITTLLAVIEQCEALISKNHKWHQEYDDYDGYADSELCEEHLKVLAAIKKVKEGK